MHFYSLREHVKVIWLECQGNYEKSEDFKTYAGIATFLWKLLDDTFITPSFTTTYSRNIQNRNSFIFNQLQATDKDGLKRPVFDLKKRIFSNLVI